MKKLYVMKIENSDGILCEVKLTQKEFLNEKNYCDKNLESDEKRAMKFGCLYEYCIYKYKRGLNFVELVIYTVHN